MVAPLIIGTVAVAAATAIAQMYNAEKARGAAKDKLKKIESMFQDLVPPDLGVNVWDDPSILKDVPPTLFDTRGLSPETIEMVGQFKPEVAQFIEEKAPELVRPTVEAETGRRAQMDALRRYGDIASSGYSPQLEAGLMEARRAAGREAQGRQASILQDAARRGTLTSGMTLASQMGASAQASDRMAMDAQRAALAQYQAQQDALGRSAALGGNVRSSEMSEQQRNADILNAFNERAASRYQNQMNYGADIANKAQMHNLGERQRIAESNIQNRYTSARANQDALNRYRSQLTQEKAANRAANMDVARSRTSTINQGYQNELAKRQGMAGVYGKGADVDISTGQSYGQAIQGLGNMTQAGMYYGMKKDKDDLES